MKRYKVIGLLAIFALTLCSCAELNKDATHTSKVDERIDSAITDKSIITITNQDDVITTPTQIKTEEPFIKLTADTVVEDVNDLSAYEYCDISYLHDNGEALSGNKVLTIGTFDGDSNYIKVGDKDDKGAIYLKLVRGEDIQNQLGDVLSDGQKVAVTGVVTHEKTKLYDATTLEYAHIVALDNDAESLKQKETSEKLVDKVTKASEPTTPPTQTITFGETDTVPAETSVTIDMPLLSLPNINFNIPTTTNDTSSTIASAKEEKDEKEGYWKRIEDAITIGCEPLYECPNCGWQHVYGVENPTSYDRCPECGMKLHYPERVEEPERYWKHVHDMVTIGGEPLYECPVCGWQHVYGVENPTKYDKCPECNTKLKYPR